MIKNSLITRLRDIYHIVPGTETHPCECDRCTAARIIEELDKLHQPWPNIRECKECCLPWPCLTSRTLNLKEANDE